MSTPHTLAATRQALLTLLRDVPAVGVVHAQERFANSDSGFKAAYQYTHADPAADAFGADAHIRGWHLRRIATQEVTANGRILNAHTWALRGYLSFRDALDSELIFDDLIERMRAAVRLAPALGLPGLLGALSVAGHDGRVSEERGVQVSSAGPVLFAGALCHSAVLELSTRNWVERSKP